jgi:intracellular sulfur oxidation DsrE/DsrF family protein
MRKILPTILLVTISHFAILAQEKVSPIIQGYGEIFDAPHATVLPDPNMEYNIVIDVATGSNDKSAPFYSLINVARLLNLHAMGGVPKENLHVVLAIHGGAVWSVLDNESYKERFNVDNPHLPLFRKLQDAGVKMVVCSQSLMGRNLDHQKLAPGIEVATSMLSTLTTYQLKGYAALKF